MYTVSICIHDGTTSNPIKEKTIISTIITNNHLERDHAKSKHQRLKGFHRDNNYSTLNWVLLVSPPLPVKISHFCHPIQHIPLSQQYLHYLTPGTPSDPIFPRGGMACWCFTPSERSRTPTHRVGRPPYPSIQCSTESLGRQASSWFRRRTTPGSDEGRISEAMM